jgi:hypothetical protein
MRIIGLALALITAAACGRGKSGENVSDVSAEVPATQAEAPAAVPAQGTEVAADQSQMGSLRLLGVRAPGPVRVGVASVELMVDGQSVPAPVDGSELDIGNDQSAWLLTTFRLPADARRVAITLRFKPEGMVERAGKALQLDLRGPPLVIVASAEQLRKRGKVVLEVDLVRSLVDQGEQLLLLPSFVVRY